MNLHLFIAKSLLNAITIYLAKSLHRRTPFFLQYHDPVNKFIMVECIKVALPRAETLLLYTEGDFFVCSHRDFQLDQDKNGPQMGFDGYLADWSFLVRAAQSGIKNMVVVIADGFEERHRNWYTGLLQALSDQSKPAIGVVIISKKESSAILNGASSEYYDPAYCIPITQGLTEEEVLEIIASEKAATDGRDVMVIFNDHVKSELRMEGQMRKRNHHQPEPPPPDLYSPRKLLEFIENDCRLKFE